MAIKNKEHLSPLFKWTGGKRREIKNFASYFPEYVTSGEKYTFVEPFVGGGAVYWYLNNVNGRNVINDWDSGVTNLYNAVKKQDKELITAARKMSELFETEEQRDERMAAYYAWRDMDKNGGLTNLSDGERAAQFYIVNQLAFSGMRRFNSKGEFNVPFGHYTAFNPGLLTSQDHVKLLKKTRILTGDYRQAIRGNDNPNTFIFLDPPYTRVMKTYSADNEFDDVSQQKLCNRLKTIKRAQWLMVIDDSPLTRKLYKDYIVGEYPVSYGVNIKNRIDTNANHLIIANY